jgi:hypothetical protein
LPTLRCLCQLAETSCPFGDLHPGEIAGSTSGSAEINDKKARSVKYQITTAKLPFAKEINEFDFADTPPP